HAIYGQIDINDSTAIRSEAIRYDLINNLDELGQVLVGVYERTKIDLLRKWMSELQEHSKHLKVDYSTDAEANAIQLIREVNTLLRKIGTEDEVARDLLIKQYLDKLDPDLDTLNEARRQFDQSVRMINRTITRYLNEQEQQNQKLVPHFFEKFQTDGVEYNLYVGQSLLQNGTFAHHHLQNLRLWQLRSMVEIKRRLQQLRPELPIDLSLSFLIFVHDSTISIQFRMDEKRFDVEGAQDVRYEILKKRLDKALVLDSTERLTADGKIAIAFIQQKDKREYMQYLNYLIREGLLHPNIEEVAIEPLQGAVGLSALRIEPIQLQGR
nr:hypothetical protein [Saprospiraceae bacterium]